MSGNINSEQLALLMEENMGLVVLLANSFKPKNSNELDEFVQLGRIGLWKAIQKHDPKKSRLSTTIWHYIRWEILRYIDKEKKNKGFLEIDESIYEDSKSIGSVSDFFPDNLNKKEVDVIRLRLEGYTFLDIGKKLGYSRGWANNTFKSAVKKINDAN